MAAKRIRGFSLVEVVIASGIAAVALVVLLGLLAGLAARAADARDRRIAAGMADEITAQLRGLAQERGWMALTGATAMTAGVRLVAGPRGEGMREYEADGIPASREEHFLITARRLESGALAFRSDRPVLPLRISVEWPFRSSGGSELPEENRDRIEFLVVLRR